MQVFKNELKVYRGENFTIDKILQNRDGTPYVISSALANPYFLISVSNTQYSQQNRYVKNYWLSLESFPRFEYTNIFDIRDIKTAETGGVSMYSAFDKVKDGILKGYLNNVLVEVDLKGYAVCTDGTGYKYWDNGWHEYECRLIKMFSSDDTQEWVSQTYLYSIQLVTGAKKPEGPEPITVHSSYPILHPTTIKVTDYVQGDSIW